MTRKPLIPLTDDQLAAIAWADPGETTADVARRLDAPYFTVAHARRRAAGPFGWHCPLVVKPCAECGKPLLASRTIQRAAHAACQRARVNRQRRERRAAGLIPASTPYVRSWRDRNPERAAMLRERELAHMNAQWPDLPPETKAGLLARVHAADARDQPLTLMFATNSGAPWSEEEDRVVLARMDDPSREVALALGRTLWAVRHRRVILRRRYHLDNELGIARSRRPAPDRRDPAIPESARDEATMAGCSPPRGRLGKPAALGRGENGGLRRCPVGQGGFSV